MSTAPMGPGWWAGSDGRWYPPDSRPPLYAYGAFGPKPRRTAAQKVLLSLIRLLTAVIFLVGGFAAGYAYYRHKDQTTSVSSAIPGTQMLVSQLNASVYGEIGNSGAQDVSSVDCIPPSHWTAGAHFTCIGFGSAGISTGTYSAVVVPSAADGNPQWVGKWVGA